jgi:hypothetical protein
MNSIEILAKEVIHKVVYNQSEFDSLSTLVEHCKEIYKTEIENAYQDGKEFAIIKDCATESTSAAHKFSVFRDQIIEAFDQGVIAEFTHQVTGAPETSGQEYFNQTYGDGVQ